MKIQWEHIDDSIRFSAFAPDDGWIAIGFNTKNDIVGSNLVMINVTDKEVVTFEDFYVVGIGNPKPVTELKSQPQVSNVRGQEKNGSTTVQFSMPIEAFDDYHFNLAKGAVIWLICAFSMEDEFDHHSRFRKHVKISL